MQSKTQVFTNGNVIINPSIPLANFLFGTEVVMCLKKLQGGWSGLGMVTLVKGFTNKFLVNQILNKFLKILLGKW